MKMAGLLASCMFS